MKKVSISRHSAYMRTWRKLAKDQKKLISIRSRTNELLRKNAALGRYVIVDANTDEIVQTGIRSLTHAARLVGVLRPCERVDGEPEESAAA